MHGVWSISYWCWLIATAVFGLGTLATIIKFFYIGKTRTATDAVETVRVVCVSCGWKGEVPRLRRRCPMCSGTSFV